MLDRQTYMDVPRRRREPSAGSHGLKTLGSDTAAADQGSAAGSRGCVIKDDDAIPPVGVTSAR